MRGYTHAYAGTYKPAHHGVRQQAFLTSAAVLHLYARTDFVATGERRPSEAHAAVEFAALVHRLL